MISVLIYIYGFIYCGNIELKNLQGSDVLNLLIAVDELNIQSLITYIQEYLIVHQTDFLHQNPTEILETVYQHKTFTGLWNFCLKIICKEPKILFNSDNFINLRTPSLELFKLDSNLVEPDRASIFASWIDRKESESSNYEKKDIPYNCPERSEGQYIFRSELTDTKSFHKNCDDKGPTIWIKIKGSTKLIGGYKPLGWIVGKVL
ncbi:hypothetical protein C1646_820363 [Rhizophagus diaphanus]|nr:hypothetical protein C1646_820363 [Rhizophagus diaphanus] [Rhizophagus sp. MUCL 43196]